MRVWLTAGATALTVLVLLASCREPTELTLELSTDLSCGELGDTSIYVGTAAELAGPLSRLTPAAVTHGCMAGKEGRIGSIVVLPSGSDDERISLRVVTGRNGADCTTNLQSGCIEARRSLGFVPHTPLFLPLELTKSCENVVCDNASDTCAGGQCVPGDVVCNGGCSTPGVDGGLIDAAPLKDVLGVKDVIQIFDAVLDDAPILLDSSSLSCIPPAPDAGVSTYTWHFDEGVGLVTSEANKALPDASLAGGATFVLGAGLACKSALSAGGTNVSLGSSASLASAAFRIDLWIQTTKVNAPIVTLKDVNSTTTAWGLSVLNGSVAATICSSNCALLSNPIVVNNGAWHSVTLARTAGGTVGLLVDGNAAVPVSPAFKPATLGELTVSFSGAVDELHFTAGP